LRVQRTPQDRLVCRPESERRTELARLLARYGTADTSCGPDARGDTVRPHCPPGLASGSSGLQAGARVLPRHLWAYPTTQKRHAGFLSGSGAVEGIGPDRRQRREVPHFGWIAFVHRPEVMTGTAVEEVHRCVLTDTIEVPRLGFTARGTRRNAVRWWGHEPSSRQRVALGEEPAVCGRLRKGGRSLRPPDSGRNSRLGTFERGFTHGFLIGLAKRVGVRQVTIRQGA